jgi:hypothetical protein
MLIVPPVAGSVGVIDQICLELRERGFTVISYSRPRFDTPYYGETGKKQGSSPAAVYRLLRIYRRGVKSLPVNVEGRALEAERLKDIQFLLSYIQGDRRGDSAFSGIAGGPVFIAGYGAGGGAVIRAAASPDFTRANPGVRGIIALEAPVFSAFTGEAPPVPLAAAGGSWFRARWAGVTRWFSRLRPQKITGLGEIPRPEVPALYLVSGKALVPRHRDGRYAAVFKTLQGSREPAVLAAIPGAGPLDYSDIPEKFPLYRVFFPGTSQKPGKTRDFTRETAALMANFAALCLDTPPDALPAAIPRRENLAQDLHLETGGVWNFRNPWDILEP